MTTRPDNPGVRLPPPLLYALAILAGYLLEIRWPLPIPPGSLTSVAGFLFLAGCLALAFDSVRRFHQLRTSIVPIRPAENLVLSGPYRFTRNPMYVSLALLTVAGGLLLHTWWPIILLVPTLAVIQQFVIVPEERYLRRRFGVHYDAYTGRVRRWL